MKSDLSGKQVVMARKPQKINIVMHMPEDIHRAFWNEETEAFWMRILEKRIWKSHIDISALKQRVDEIVKEEGCDDS